MPRYSGIVQSVEQRTVNPYVTGSSPVARAKISAGFRGFLFFSNLKLFPFSVPKYRQYLYYFYTRMHFWGIKIDFFVYTFLYTAENQGFLTHCFFMTYRILVRVSVAQKSQISGTLFFTDTQIFIQFCLYLSNFLHFWDTFWDTKTDFLFIHFYTVFIHSRNLRLSAHHFLNDMQNATPYVIYKLKTQKTSSALVVTTHKYNITLFNLLALLSFSLQQQFYLLLS